jgi:hypothetical protein
MMNTVAQVRKSASNFDRRKRQIMWNESPDITVAEIIFRGRTFFDMSVL